MRPNPAAGFMWLFLALCAGGVGLFFYAYEYIWVESTEGRVAEIIWSTDGKRMCSPVFEYEADGESQRVERDVRDSACSWTEGEQLTIYYRANSPGKGYALTFFGLLPAIIGLIVMLVLVRTSYRAFRGRPFTLQQRLSVVPIVKLADAPRGEVVGIRGTLKPRDKLHVAPMTQRQCVAWQLEVHRYVDDNTPVLLRHDIGIKQFELDDGHGRATIDPGQDAKLLLLKDQSGRTKERPAPRLTEYLRSKGVSEKGSDTVLLDFKWREGIVELGGEATVYAIVQRSEGSYRLLAPESGHVVIATEDLSQYKPQT